MKNLLVISCLLAGCISYGQTLKKKLYGTYQGTIAGYTLDVGQTVVEVAPSTIRIELLEDGTALQQLDGRKTKGTWKVEDTEKAYYVITLKLKEQSPEERLILYKKAKTLTREGIFPQPDAQMTKIQHQQ